MGGPAKYPEEFRVMRLNWLPSGRPIADVARSFWITDSTLNRPVFGTVRRATPVEAESILLLVEARAVPSWRRRRGPAQW